MVVRYSLSLTGEERVAEEEIEDHREEWGKQSTWLGLITTCYWNERNACGWMRRLYLLLSKRLLHIYPE